MFGAWAEKWLRGYQMADSTRDMCRSVYERELKHKFSNQKLVEITHEDLRALTDAIVERGAPATAVHVREIVMQVFRWATERGQKVENPAELVRPAVTVRLSAIASSVSFLSMLVPLLLSLVAALNLEYTFWHVIEVFGKRWLSGPSSWLGSFVAYGHE